MIIYSVLRFIPVLLFFLDFTLPFLHLYGLLFLFTDDISLFEATNQNVETKSTNSQMKLLVKSLCYLDYGVEGLNLSCLING